MIQALLNIPHTQQDWDFFSWNHRLSHDRIRTGILQKFNINLTDYQIDPMDAQNIQGFLQNNASLHGDMLGVLGIPGIDLLDVDMSKDNQKNAWIYWHYIDHYNAESALGVGS